MQRAEEFTIVVWWKLNLKERRRLWKEYEQASLTREEEKMSSLGPYKPESDERNMCREAQEELYDILSYTRFLERKHPDLVDESAALKRLAFELFCAFKKMEEREATLDKVNRRGGK